LEVFFFFFLSLSLKNTHKTLLDLWILLNLDLELNWIPDTLVGGHTSRKEYWQEGILAGGMTSRRKRRRVRRPE